MESGKNEINILNIPVEIDPLCPKDTVYFIPNDAKWYNSSMLNPLMTPYNLKSHYNRTHRGERRHKRVLQEMANACTMFATKILGEFIFSDSPFMPRRHGVLSPAVKKVEERVTGDFKSFQTKEDRQKENTPAYMRDGNLDIDEQLKNIDDTLIKYQSGK